MPGQVVFPFLVCCVIATGCAIPQPHVVRSGSLQRSDDCRERAAAFPAEVAWSGPDSLRDRTHLDAWCRAVGEPLVEFHTPGGGAGLPADRVVVVAWNAAAGAGDLVELVARLRRGDFTDRTPVQHFAILLQEVHRTGGTVPPRVPSGSESPGRIGRPATAIDVHHAAVSLELNLFYAPAMRNGSGAEDRGNAILTTETMRDLEVLELPFERQRRIALLATLTGRTPRGECWCLRLVNTHLETRAGLTRRGPAAARARQARAIGERLASVRVPTLIAGDLNTSWGDDEPAVRELQEAFPDADSARGTTWAKGVLSARLDHVFAWLPGGRLSVYRIPERFGSDHHPLTTVVEMAAAASGCETQGP